MRLCDITRLLAVAGTVLLAVAATPALAQTADVTVTATAPAGGINVGATNDYEVVVTNAAAAAAATNVTLTVTVPAPLQLGDPANAVAAFRGCVQSAADPASCTVATLAPGASATIVVSALYPAPATPPASCPTGETVGAFTASVVAQNDTTPATATVASTPVNPFADVEVVVTPPSSSINSGERRSINTVVRNNGPCVADAVAVEFSFPDALAFDSVTGDANFCEAPTTLDVMFTDGGCTMGDLAVGASRTFDAVFQLAALPDDLIRAKYPFTVSAAAATMHDSKPLNNTGEAPNSYEKDESGCSTGGASTLFGLAGLAALRLRRRRS